MGNSVCPRDTSLKPILFDIIHRFLRWVIHDTVALVQFRICTVAAGQCRISAAGQATTSAVYRHQDHSKHRMAARRDLFRSEQRVRGVCVPFEYASWMSLAGIARRAHFKFYQAALASKIGQNNRKRGKDASCAACFHVMSLFNRCSARRTFLVMEDMLKIVIVISSTRPSWSI